MENQIGFLSKGQWLGEEYPLMDIPILYNAVANSNVKLLMLPLQDV